MAEFTKARIAQAIFNEKRFVCHLSLTTPCLKSNFANVKKSQDYEAIAEVMAMTTSLFKRNLLLAMFHRNYPSITSKTNARVVSVYWMDILVELTFIILKQAACIMWCNEHSSVCKHWNWETAWLSIEQLGLQLICARQFFDWKYISFRPCQLNRLHLLWGALFFTIFKNQIRQY